MRKAKKAHDDKKKRVQEQAKVQNHRYSRNRQVTGLKQSDTVALTTQGRNRQGSNNPIWKRSAETEKAGNTNGGQQQRTTSRRPQSD